MARGPAFVAGHSNAVVGADEFVKRLRAMDRNLASEFGKAGREIGKKVVADQKSEATAYSRQAAAASAAITIASQNTRGSAGGIVLRLSGSKVPFAIGAEFGAKKYPQFPRWKGNQWSGVPEGIGYFFHPGIAENQEEALDLYMQAVQHAAARAGIDVGTGPRKATAFDVAAGQASQLPTFML